MGKAMLCKHATRYGMQWDCNLCSVLWACLNISLASTGEKHCLDGIWEAPQKLLLLITHSKYYGRLLWESNTIIVISKEIGTRVNQVGTRSIQALLWPFLKANGRYKMREWIFIRFPAEETGCNRKLSRPWHRPYRITAHQDPDVSVVFPSKYKYTSKVYANAHHN